MKKEKREPFPFPGTPEWEEFYETVKQAEEESRRFGYSPAPSPADDWHQRMRIKDVQNRLLRSDMQAIARRLDEVNQNLERVETAIREADTRGIQRQVLECIKRIDERLSSELRR